MWSRIAAGLNILTVSVSTSHSVSWWSCESACVWCGVGGCVGGRHGELTLLQRILILDPLQLHCTEVILDDSALSPSSSRLQCSLASLQCNKSFRETMFNIVGNNYNNCYS